MQEIIQSMSNPQVWVSFFTLLTLEIVLGIDNVVFISILSEKLPKEQQEKARYIGLGLALVTRVALLFAISWIVGLDEPFTTIMGLELSWRDIILAVGGLFLIGKATYEIHDNLEGKSGHADKKGQATFAAVIGQILLLDSVFTIDSVLTAVGIADHIWVMVAAVIIAVGIMIAAVDPISNFVSEHPAIKMLALSFLVMIGFSLILEAGGIHVPKGYIYSAMGFSIAVELLQLWMRSNREPVNLHKRHQSDKKKEQQSSAASD